MTWCYIYIDSYIIWNPINCWFFGIVNKIMRQISFRMFNTLGIHTYEGIMMISRIYMEIASIRNNVRMYVCTCIWFGAELIEWNGAFWCTPKHWPLVVIQTVFSSRMEKCGSPQLRRMKSRAKKFFSIW